MSKYMHGRRLDLKNGRVEMAHGAGGDAMDRLIREIFRPAFSNEYLNRENDQAIFNVAAGRMVMTTDSFVVSPLFFPGGDIGALAINGTVNDVALAGARPTFISASFILEEGLALVDIKRIVDSMSAAARDAGVLVVAGDTKVVERGKADGVFITTTGLGVVDHAFNLSADMAQPGDLIILSGSLGDHGMAILSTRESLSFESEIISDQACLHELIALMIAGGGDAIRIMRDPTRGGLASALNEIAQQSKVGMRISETALAVKPAVAAACEILGFDPLYVANEGKLVAICAPGAAATVLAAMRAHPRGHDAAVIGEVIRDDHCLVQLVTAFGGSRIIDRLSGEQLPRIC